MMSFFASPYCAPAVHSSQPNFTSLFRLLDEFDNYNRDVQAPRRQQQEQQPHQPRQPQQQRASVNRRADLRRAMTTFRPKFDVRETETAYELQGELPGIERENLNIEFTDPQTMVVRGRVERSYESKPETTAETGEKAAADDADETASTTSSHGWHHATVEDDPEEPATPRSSTPVETPKTTEVAQPATKEVATTPKPEAPAPTPRSDAKFWVYERSVGEFSRTFNFPSRVDHDGVAAELHNGVLSITVPKAKQHQPRRIAIF